MSKNSAFAHLPTLTFSMALLSATVFEPKGDKAGNAKLMMKVIKIGDVTAKAPILVEKYVSLEELQALQKAGALPGATLTVLAKGINQGQPRRIPANDKYPESLAYPLFGVESITVGRGFVPMDLDAVASAPVEAPAVQPMNLDLVAAAPAQTEKKGLLNQLGGWLQGL